MSITWQYVIINKITHGEVMGSWVSEEGKNGAVIMESH